MSAEERGKGGRLFLAGGFSGREGLRFPSCGVCVPYSSSSTHRRALYIVTYLLFPINVLVGVLAGVWRMVISGLYNSIHFGQLDISLLNRSVETFDPGRTWRGGSLCNTVSMGALLPPSGSQGTQPGAPDSPGAAGSEGGFRSSCSMFRNGQMGQLEQVASHDGPAFLSIPKGG